MNLNSNRTHETIHTHIIKNWKLYRKKKNSYIKKNDENNEINTLHIYTTLNITTH